MGKMTIKQARRFLRRHSWNLAPTKLETYGESKAKNLKLMKERALSILKKEK